MEVIDLNYSYSKNIKVLHDINLDISEPGLYCILGPNGVGKSTLIKCMNKLLEPTSGQVLIDGKDVKDMTLKEVSEFIGYVPVKTQDMFSMPVIDTILMGRHNKHRWRTKREDLAIVHRIMKVMGILELSNRNFNELSAGQHQKVAIARGLAQEPEMLILDEPTSNLDVKHQVYVTELLRALAVEKDMVVLMISHDLNIAAKYAHQLIVMSEPGRIHAVGAPAEIITEGLIRDVYGIESKVIVEEGRPHVILGSAIPMDECRPSTN